MTTLTKNADFDRFPLMTSQPQEIANKFNYDEYEIDHELSNEWDGVRALPLSPQRMAQKTDFLFFGIKFNFNRIKSATKFCCVKTSSGKVVEQSISPELTEKYRTESVSFHLKYWLSLKLTYPFVASSSYLRLLLKVVIRNFYTHTHWINLTIS